MYAYSNMVMNAFKAISILCARKGMKCINAYAKKRTTICQLYTQLRITYVVLSVSALTNGMDLDVCFVFFSFFRPCLA